MTTPDTPRRRTAPSCSEGVRPHPLARQAVRPPADAVPPHSAHRRASRPPAEAAAFHTMVVPAHSHHTPAAHTQHIPAAPPALSQRTPGGSARPRSVSPAERTPAALPAQSHRTPAAPPARFLLARSRLTGATRLASATPPAHPRDTREAA
ncbi:hypothetical protein [Lentzea albidocapillata]|uniref:hypothetical protein n=1 Tax=Lentzea albidocapillata TaxID=40571 RepID=UPI0011843E10|nr:hypothetical protein [Lentzea albidocapillata]